MQQLGKPPTAQVTLTGDIVILRPGDEHERYDILLIQRGRPPFERMYALPGGKLNGGESIDEAAQRELREETGLQGVNLEQVQVFSAPDRDPRGHYVSVAFLGFVSRQQSEQMTCAGDDATSATWHAITQLPPLAFDHLEIVEAALQHFGREQFCEDLAEALQRWQNLVRPRL